MIRRKIIFLAACCMLFVFLLFQDAGAEKKLTTEIIGGEVGAISNNFISIIYLREKGIEKELSLPIPKGVKVVHRKNLHEIKTGDFIEIQFEVTKEGGKVIDRKAKVITFLRPGQEEVVEFLTQEDKGGGNIIWKKRKKSDVSW